jgi:hypothetical protein
LSKSPIDFDDILAWELWHIKPNQPLHKLLETTMNEFIVPIVQGTIGKFDQNFLLSLKKKIRNRE